MSYNFKDLEAVTFQWAADSTNCGVIAQEVSTEFAFREPQPNNITLFAGRTEMLKVAEDGFYVRGEKVPTDGREAAIVYNAFKEFLVWSRLHKD